MDAKAGECRRSEPLGLDVTIFARYHWSVARSTTSSESQESYLTTGTLPYKHSSFFPPTHGSIMLPPRQPRVFARLARWQLHQENKKAHVHSADIDFFPLLWISSLFQIIFKTPNPSISLYFLLYFLFYTNSIHP